MQDGRVSSDFHSAGTREFGTHRRIWRKGNPRPFDRDLVMGFLQLRLPTVAIQMSAKRGIETSPERLKCANTRVIPRRLRERVESTPSGSFKCTDGSAGVHAKRTLRTASLRLIGDCALAAAGLCQGP